MGYVGRLPHLPWGRLLKATWSEFWDDQGSFVASGVAFRVALAVFPGIAILVWLGTRLVGPAEAPAVLAALKGVVPDSAVAIVKQALDASARANPVDGGGSSRMLGTLAPVAGLLFAIWSTNSGVWALFDALNVVYDTTERRSLVRIVLLTLAFTLVTLLLAVVATTLLVVVPAVLSRGSLPEPARVALSAARWPIAVAVYAVALAALFHYGPNRPKQHWHPVTVGSTAAAVLLVLTSALFSWFTESFADLALTYGSLSTVVSFMLWLWISFIVVLAGAELDSCIEAERLGG